MKSYSYMDIQEITKNGITFNDGMFIDFNDCIVNAREYFKNDTTSCVAERNAFAQPPYFIFFTDTRVKIEFNQRKGLFAKNKNYRDFQNMHSVLQSFNVSSYDLS